MSKRISSFSVIIVFSCLTILGFFFIPQLSMKLNPSRKHPIVNVSFNMWGQSARVVEAEVTSKLEAMLNRMKGVQSMNSYSGNGAGRITINLSEHINPDIARFEVSTIIRQAWPSFPEGVSYPSIQMLGTSEEANYPFLRYTVNAPYSPIEIQDYVDQNIRPQLANIKGIEKIDVSGASRYIYKLDYDFYQLQNHNVSIDDIRAGINTYLAKEHLGIGLYEVNHNEMESIRINLQTKDTEDEFDASKIQIINKEGKIIYLNQLVSVNFVEEEASSFYRINGLNSIYLSLTAQDKSNQLALSKTIQEKINEIKNSFPSGYELHLTYNESEYIEGELNKIYMRSSLTIFILLLFVFIVYRNLKYSILIILSLIANISIAAIFYYLIGVEMHLFSLAGLTISLTLIIDNTIIMSDQIVQQGNKKAFVSILTATITTIGALSIIFLLDENIQLNLFDFAILIIINLSLSLIIAISFVPALIDKLKLTKKVSNKEFTTLMFLKFRPKRLLVYFNKSYEAIILFCSKKRIKRLLILFVILVFGIPIFMLPDKLGDQSYRFINNEEEQQQTNWTELYNHTLGSRFYKEKVKPIVDVALGGTIRLFAQKVNLGSYGVSEREETSLHVVASLPNGSTLSQMDALIKKMENYISQYNEVRQFETSIHNGQKASIRILFQKKHQRGSFPYILYSKLITKATELGGGSWAIYGVGDGFNNELKEHAGSSRIKLLGYNYDELITLAQNMRDSLLQHRRIKEVIIDSEFNWFKTDYKEFTFNLKKENLAKENIQPWSLFDLLNPIFQKSTYIATWTSHQKATPIHLYSILNKQLDVWSLSHLVGKIGDSDFRLSELASIEEAQLPQNISKENQQYKLCLQYEYIGNYQQASRVMERSIDTFNKNAPLGYKAEREYSHYWWQEGGTSQYWLLFLIIAIMFLTTSILFNSIKRPFVVIFIIPLSFIGVFLTFYFFDLNFDQGGFAAFILLSGLSTNANIYILNEYDNIRKANKNITAMRAYIKAWNAKIRPIFLTIVSTILGFIPFMVGELKEAFWFPLAAGTIGGLISSFIALFIFLPLFMNVKSKN